MRIQNANASSHIVRRIRETSLLESAMTSHLYTQLIRYKQWADRGLCDVVAGNLDRLDAEDAAVLLRILDHFHVVDKIFRHHLDGVPHSFNAPRSETIPDFRTLARRIMDVDEWYASYVAALREKDFDEPVDFVFSNGNPSRMRRGDILLHVCLHGTYHRGNAGILLQKNGIAPNDDRITDFLEKAA
jgi:uncharacterized damage-inducible protein DinB